MELTDEEICYMYDALAALTPDQADGCSNTSGSAMQKVLLYKLQVELEKRNLA